MVREFKLPDVGEGVAEGEIVSWLVEEGDTVTEDQPVAEVETDKAIVEVPSPVDGTVREIIPEEGEVVEVGSVIITFDVEGEPVEEGQTEGEARRAAEADAGAAEAEASGSETEQATTQGDATEETVAEEVSTGEGRVFAAPSARRVARELGVDIAAVDGSGPSGRVTEQDVRRAAESADAGGEPGEPDVSSPMDGSASTGGPEMTETPADSGSPSPGAGGSPSPVESADRDRTLAAPATRRIAEEQGVDLNAVPATEQRDGEAFVTSEAVMQYAEAQRQAQQSQAETAAQTPAGERVERIQYKGVRKTIGDAMSQSKYTAPHVTHHDTAVVDALVETRERLKPRAEERGIRLTYMPFVMKAVVASLKQHPKLNAELDEEAGEILRKNYYNVGVATATDAGLMVPVVDDVDGKGLLQISSEVNELVQKARDRSISRDELQGSTFSVTNFGAIGGEYATPILNYPEAAILGIGELKQRPVVEDGEVVAKHTLPISLTIDHRIVDGADAAAFANTFIEYVENPELLLLE
ncbi:dihydrolipoamide acetyltransferase family protein [Halorussus sp. MSC15.2]|uniref:dihydrolipoamide acetyltransferase family protein n=1 Tax=Halorussus sp. MSC15.2 TaxID=2283638 RepID=UPI0013D6F351|nr:dihydrolipoamide acetyltransferase family protein [Halorussus sp. MSC15.2]NEU58569.1 2-oxo acid dehydrogenase subunit E2 [Halorussus sp. MSC15.2]